MTIILLFIASKFNCLTTNIELSWNVVALIIGIVYDAVIIRKLR